jgi:gamma-glutamyltranspeptidase
MSDNLPLSEQFRIVAKKWNDADAAASILEETKTAVFAQRQLALGDMAVNRAEMLVKASPEWAEHIEKIVNARTEANRLKLQVEYIKMRHREWISADANMRAEMKL